MLRTAFLIIGPTIGAGFLLSIALIFIPEVVFTWIEHTSVKMVLFCIAWILSLLIGLSVYWMFHIPAPRRLLLSMIWFLVPSAIVGALSPIGNKWFQTATIHHKAKATNFVDLIKGDNQEFDANMTRSDLNGWDFGIFATGMAFALVVACIFVRDYTNLAKWEHTAGVMLS